MSSRSSLTGRGVSLRIAESTDRLRVALERPLAGRHLVEQDAEREDVGAAVDRKPLRLLGRHVGDGADDAAVLGDGLRLPRGAVALVGVVAQLREAEVEHLDPPVRGEHHVLGLEVAVEDALAVGGGDRVREVAIASESSRSIAKPRGGIDLPSVSPSTCSIVRKRSPSASSIECRVTIPGWLSEATARASRSKRCELLGVGRHLGRQHLEGHPPREARVLREIDLPHASRAERLDDPVGAERPADEAGVGLRLWHDDDYDAPGRRLDPGRDNC